MIRRLILLTLLVPALLSARGMVRVSMNSVKGTPSQELVLNISMENDVPVGGLQLTVAEAPFSSVGTPISSSRLSGFSSSAIMNEGGLNLLLYSLSGDVISPGEGELIQIPVTLADKAFAGSLPVTVKASDVEGSPIAATSDPFLVSVECPEIEYVNGKVIDFGHVPINSDYTSTLNIRNTGTSELVISGVGISSPAFSLECELPVSVAPSLTVSLPVRFSPMERGEVSATMTVESNCGSADNVLRLLADPFAVNELRISNVSGRSDSEVTVSIGMENMDLIDGFTLDISLPDNVEYVDNSFVLSDRGEGQTLSLSASSRHINATAYSIDEIPFSGNEGPIAEFKVRLTGRGTSTISFTKAVLASLIGDEVQNVTSDVYPGKVTVTAPSISVPSSISLGSTPVTESASGELVIWNYGSEPLLVNNAICEGCDLILPEFPIVVQQFGSTTINLRYLSNVEGKFDGTITFYSDDPDKRSVTVNVSGEKYCPNDLVLDALQLDNYTGKLTICLRNYDAISGIQLDLDTLTDFRYGEVQVTERTRGWRIDQFAVDNRLRIFCYSLAGETLSPGNDPVLEIPLLHESTITDGIYPLRVSSVLLSDQNSRNRYSGVDPLLSNYEFFINSEIKSVREQAELNETGVFNINGVKVLPNDEQFAKLPPGIYIINGVKILK